MAYPTILYDATNGSDSAASGAGPATAVTGSSAAHTGGASTTTITLTNSPDLSGVATDGSAALWLNVGADSRHLSKITAADDGADTVTVEDAFNIASGSAVDYAIGGERKTLENRSSWPDWKDQKPGWVFEFDAGTYDVTTAPGNPSTTGGSANPRFRWLAASGAATRPFIRQTSNIYLLNITATGDWTFGGLKFGTNNGTASLTYITTTTTCSLILDDCVVDPGGAGHCFYNYRTLCIYVFRGCHFSNASSQALYLSGDDTQNYVSGCVFDGGGGSDFSVAAIHIAGGDEQTTVIRDCLMFDGAGRGVYVTLDTRRHVSIEGNTIVDNAGDGVTLDLDLAGYATVMTTVVNNVLAYNGGYGINLDGTGGSAPQVEPRLIDHNAFRSNTSGARNNLSAGANDVTLTADPFEDRASDDYSLNDTAGGGAAIDDEGFPVSLPDGT